MRRVHVAGINLDDLMPIFLALTHRIHENNKVTGVFSSSVDVNDCNLKLKYQVVRNGGSGGGLANRHILAGTYWDLYMDLIDTNQPMDYEDQNLLQWPAFNMVVRMTDHNLRGDEHAFARDILLAKMIYL